MSSAMSGVGMDPICRERQYPGLTQRQAALMSFIEGYTESNGCSPSIAEMAECIGGGKSNVHRMIVCLEERGYIHRARFRARGIEVVRNRHLPIICLTVVLDEYGRFIRVRTPSPDSTLVRITCRGTMRWATKLEVTT